jgi:hypothetical protein
MHNIMELLSYPCCKRFRGRLTSLKIQKYRNFKKNLRGSKVKPKRFIRLIIFIRIDLITRHLIHIHLYGDLIIYPLILIESIRW